MAGRKGLDAESGPLFQLEYIGRPLESTCVLERLAGMHGGHGVPMGFLGMILSLG